MVLSHKLITRDYHRVLEDRNTILLIIIHLHIEKKINDAKLKALFKNYRNGALTRHINTYYSKVNDRWYNDEPMRNIYLDIYEFMPKKDLSLEQVLPYLNLLLNRNKNYCIDFIYKQYVEPVTRNIDLFNNNTIELFNSFQLNSGLVSLTPYHQVVGLGSGYCCEDHDGDYEDYKRRNYEYSMGREFKDKLIEKAKSFLQSKKTWGSYKNPNNILL